ncbi:MAG: TonB-dependent receptor [Paludibacter sp.]|nr:TonB-dependent receptor [Paludibacter sp.]
MKKSKTNGNNSLRHFLIILFCILFLNSSLGYAQQTVMLSGVVKDIAGEPLVGASVQVKGKSTGTITDLGGRFRLETKTKDEILIVSYLGYLTKEIPVKAERNFIVVLEEDLKVLDEVQVVAYGVQEKKTLTGAITSVGTENLIKSPNASVANTLAGQLTGVTTIQSTGQPGKEDPQIYVRGAGSLTDDLSQPLILVDGVERSFFQMDPNEIESINVLKDASATAVFGVRGANGVILVTTRRGERGKAKISYSSSAGLQVPVQLLGLLSSYEMAQMFNEMDRNDNKQERFDQYTLDRYRLGDEPILYPNTNWREYLLKDFSMQTQHNINISGGSEHVRYFTSVGYLYQNGLMKDLGDLPYDANYKYNRFNYRTNLDVDVTKTTTIKLNIGGIVGDTYSPIEHGDGMWRMINWGQPFASPGIVDGHLININKEYAGNMNTKNPLLGYWGKGYKENTDNTLNLDISLLQKLDFVTKGLSLQIKGAYNTDYTFKKSRASSVETWAPFYLSHAQGRPLSEVENADFDRAVVYRISGTNGELGYGEPDSDKDRDWYLEGSLNYDRKFNDHQISALLLYNQSKNYYPSDYAMNPTAYVGLVSRVSYNYKQKYMAEFNAGYNGSENFAPGRRYGFFPAGSVGWVVTGENFMADQQLFDFLKLRASIGLVGNDKIGGKRYLYLPDSYNVNQAGYNFGYDLPANYLTSSENKISSPYVTWETALKKNLGIDMAIFKNRLRLSGDYFVENRTGILITRNSIPGVMAFTSGTLPAVNLGEVDNRGFELEAKWNHKFHDFRYWIDANISFAKNKIIYMDEIPPLEAYQSKTGQSTSAILGYMVEGFYSDDDFVDLTNKVLKSDLPVPVKAVSPGDVKYVDVNGDHLITEADMKFIGYPSRPEYVAGLNCGISYKGFDLSMNWMAVWNRSILLQDFFRIPGAATGIRAIYRYMMDERWTPETANTALAPRLSVASSSHNYMDSQLWIRDGSYLRLKNAKLGYTFQKNAFLKQFGISQLSLFVTGYNLLTFDNIKIVDPESKPSAEDTYPIVKIYNLGINVAF